MTTLLAITSVLAVGYADPSIESLCQKDLQDATFVAVKVKAVQRELQKINDDFGTSYKFDQIRFQYKEPLKLRLEATVEDTSAIYIIDGARQIIKIPRLRINSKQDLSRSPGRRQTPLDFGVLTPSLFTDLFVARFVRTDRETGDYVFDITYNPKLDDTSRNRIWVDKARGIVNKREWYNQSGRQLATFIYEAPKEVGGVWVPTKMTVKNVDNQVAGITRYDSVKVNTGLPDSLFELK
jgi:outer membrane lipoprotein-sorting protein